MNYTWYSVKKCLAYPLSVFFQVERRRDDARRERRSSALKGPGAHRQIGREAAGRDGRPELTKSPPNSGAVRAQSANTSGVV